MKFNIKSRFTGKVIFIAEINASEDCDYGLKLGMAVKQAIKQGVDLRGLNLKGANLEGSDLRGADLAYADLERSNLVGVNLQNANLTGANLRYANLEGLDLEDVNLEPIKKDMFEVLSRAIPEIPMLKKAIIDGRINGSTYTGECACLCGTIEKGGRFNGACDMRDSERPIERFFLGIGVGDTPETSQFSKLALEWIEEFERNMKMELV